MRYATSKSPAPRVNAFTTCSGGTPRVRLNVSRMIVGVTPMTMSMIFDNSSIPNAMNRIGNSESATILSKNRKNRRKKAPTYGNIPCAAPAGPRERAAPRCRRNRRDVATVSFQSMLERIPWSSRGLRCRRLLVFLCRLHRRPCKFPPPSASPSASRDHRDSRDGVPARHKSSRPPQPQTETTTDRRPEPGRPGVNQHGSRRHSSITFPAQRAAYSSRRTQPHAIRLALHGAVRITDGDIVDGFRAAPSSPWSKQNCRTSAIFFFSSGDVAECRRLACGV